MPNYDFHNSLSPPEFERFAGDLLEIREGLPFERFGEGADGGIDLRATDNDGNTVIVQVKRYQNDFRQLFYVLKTTELPKVRKLQPHRYLLVTSVSLTPKNVDAMFKLFSPFIRSKQDILGRAALNRLLGLPEYDEVERRHYKLWLTSSTVLQHLLREEVNRSALNDSRDELERIANELPLYVQNSSFSDALKLIDEHNFVMISGPPGSGKTMLGRALVAYHLEIRSFEEFVYVRGSLDDAQSLYDEERYQVFFFDDFWESVFAKNPNDRSEETRLLHFLDKINDRSNKKLVLTTREYVLQQGAQRRNYPELARFLSESKCVVNPDMYTYANRAQILFNHLHFSDLDADTLSSFIYLEEYRPVIEHVNYTPRLIKTYIREFNKTGKESVFFGREFLNFLANPYNFFADVFDKQTATGKLTLLIILISNDPIRYVDLFRTLKNAVGPAKAIGIHVDITSFPEALASLEQTFLVTSELNVFEPGEVKVEFVNPSVKDFLLHYLRQNIEVYGDILIRSACFFNQLDFIFDTKPDANIFDVESDEPLYGNAIVLEGEHRILLKRKMLDEFESLSYSTLRSEWGERYTCHSPKSDTMVWELIRLTFLFDLNAEEDVRHFVVQKHDEMTDMLFANTDGKALSRVAMSNYPQLTKVVLCHTKRSFEGIVAAFYKSITFTSEFRALGWLGEVFPDEYRQFVDTHLDEIKAKVVALIIEDAEYFGEDGNDMEFAQLVDEDMSSVLGMFQMCVTRKLIRQVYQAADQLPPWRKASQQRIDDEDHVKQIPDEDLGGADIEQDFQSLLHCPSSDNFLDEGDVDELISALGVSSEVSSQIKGLLSGITSAPYSDLLQDRLVVTTTCDAIVRGDLNAEESKSAPVLATLLIRSQIAESTAASDFEVKTDDVFKELAAVAFNVFVEPNLATAKKVYKQLENGSLPPEIGVDEFVSLCSPLLSLQRQRVTMVSEFIARCCAAIHVSAFDDAASAEFYSQTLPDFAQDTIVVLDGWWHALAYFDENRFFRSVIEPVVGKTLSELQHIEQPQRFVSYLLVLQLEFTIKKTAPYGEFELRCSGVGNPDLDDLAECFLTELSSGDIANWFVATLNEAPTSKMERLVDLCNPSMQDHSHEKSLTFDFCKWRPTSEQSAIVEEVGNTNGFEKLLEAFCSVMRDIVQSQRVSHIWRNSQ